MTAIGDGFRGSSGKPGYLLRQAYQVFRAAMDEHLREIGLTASHFSILTLIDVRPGVTGAQLAKDSLLTNQSVSEAISNLEKAGLIIRSRGVDDKRVRRIDLTSEGRSKLEVALPIVDALEERMLEDLAPDDKERFRQWLVDVAAKLTYAYRLVPAGD